MTSNVFPSIEIRPLGAFYLKNHINTYWSDYNEPKATTDPEIITLGNAVNVPSSDSSQRLFVVSDPDKDYLRNVLIDAIIRTKDPLRCVRKTRVDAISIN